MWRKISLLLLISFLSEPTYITCHAPTDKKNDLSFLTALEQCAQSISHTYNYNPHIELLYYNSSTVPDRLFLFCHGWGANRFQAYPRARYLQKLEIFEPVLTFDFRDAVYGMWGLARLRHSTIGQMSDIRILILLLNTCYKTGIRAVDLVGHSRGGGVIISAVGVLADTTGCYDQELKNLGVDEEARQGICNMLKGGSLLLEDPCVDVSAAIKQHIKVRCPFKSICAKIHSFIEHIILPRCMCYCPKATKPIDYSEQVARLNIPMIVQIQLRDASVSNKRIIDWYKQMYHHYITRQQQPYLYFVAGDSVWGHHAKSEQLFGLLNAFRATHGGSHAPHISSEEYDALVKALPIKEQEISTFIEEVCNKAKNKK